MFYDDDDDDDFTATFVRLNGPMVMKRSQRWNSLQICPCREIRTQVVVICDPTRYQLDQGGAPLALSGFLT